MRLRHALALTASLALTFAFTACDSSSSGGGTPGTTTTPGSGESAFDDFFGTGGSLSGASDEATNTAACADDDPDCVETTDPVDPDPVEIDLPQCTASLPIPSGASATCTPFCQKIAECRGDTSLLTACVADCADSLRGIELARAGEIFACFTAATCEDFDAYGGGSGTSTNTAEPTPAPMPDPADEGGSSDGAEEEDPYYPEDGYEYVEYDDPIGDCMEALFEGWSQQTLPAAKLAVCEETLAMEDDCDGGDVVSSGGSSGSSSAGVPASSTDTEEPSADDGGADQAPMPPEDEYYEDDYDNYEGELAECTAVAGLLSQTVLDRIRACYDEEDCDAREDCLDEQLACVPFLPAIIFGGVSSADDVTVEVTDPVEPNEANPTDPADGE